MLFEVGVVYVKTSTEVATLLQKCPIELSASLTCELVSVALVPLRFVRHHLSLLWQARAILHKMRTHEAPLDTVTSASGRGSYVSQRDYLRNDKNFRLQETDAKTTAYGSSMLAAAEYQEQQSWPQYS